MISNESCVFINIGKIIFHEFEKKELSFMNFKKRFFFIVNGKIDHTNSLVANIINYNISKNYQEKMNNKVFKLLG